MSWSWTEFTDKYVIQSGRYLAAGRAQEEEGREYHVPMCMVFKCSNRQRGYPPDHLNPSQDDPPHVHGHDEGMSAEADISC